MAPKRHDPGILPLENRGYGFMSSGINAVGLPAAHGGIGAAVFLLAAVYIDGVNHYDAIDDLKENHLKWVNFDALARRIIRRDETLVRVVWCTAVNKNNVQKMLRWREFRKAQISVGVVCVEGHFTEEPRRCHRNHS